MSTPFGVNLSFCVKRWVTPDLWAPLVRNELGLNLVQFSFDLVDPTWPDDLLRELGADIRRQCEDHGISIHSAFIGLAHYTFNQLLHPDRRVRDLARAGSAGYAYAAWQASRRVGWPLGAVASGSMAASRMRFRRRTITALWHASQARERGEREGKKELSRTDAYAS